MALRARLVAPPPKPAPEWRWHTAKVKTVPARLLFAGERRMEAETYLASGFGLRVAIESLPSGWNRFGDLANAWTPPRIKMIHVDEAYGVPYLNTSQVFDVRPSPRKWLAMGRTTAGKKRLAKQGTILVMASATPGRATITTKAHENAIISHHFMRIEPKESASAGWLYAFLKSNRGYAMVSGSQYASIIRHIEPSHLAAIPVPDVDAETKSRLNRSMSRVIELRNQVASKTTAAEEVFYEGVAPPPVASSEAGFSVPAHTMFAGRRRLEAAYHTPIASTIVRAFRRSESLQELTKDVYWMSRFKRAYGDGGIPYLSADELFTTNPEMRRQILVAPKDGHERYFVEREWIVMACSGQVYGLNGAAMLTTAQHEGTFFSHDLIRIIPDRSKIRPGYLLTALTHPTLGRPVLIREAYGTSIPHLDPGDVANFPVVRLDESTEDRIADLAEDAARARAEADEIERGMAAEADEIIERFIA